MITGFNTDIEYNGVVYHVQTEDKGLESPLILSLVYVGGAILAAKRSRYEDLIEAGFSEDVLTKRLKRQHQLICAAINAGRIEDLKRMGARSLDGAPDEAALIGAEPGTADVAPVRDTAPLEDRLRREAAFANAEQADDTLHDPPREWSQNDVLQPDKGLTLTILDEPEFRAGETLTIRIELAERAGKRHKPLQGMPLSVKILGTAFRPQIYSVKTERGGLATVTATMPTFTSGRAAVLVRAVVKGETLELRRVIRPAE